VKIVKVSQNMAKKKKYRGHYCKVCDNILPNEKFSGKGHAKHICKKCSSLPKNEQHEQKEINNIYSLMRFPNLSKQNKIYLEHLFKNQNLAIRNAAIEMLKHFTEIYTEADFEYEIFDDEVIDYEDINYKNTHDENLLDENLYDSDYLELDNSNLENIYHHIYYNKIKNDTEEELPF
jgi:hypothetical protein